MTPEINVQIDANQRPNPLLEPKDKGNRLLNIAIPYLSLYAPTAMLVAIGMGTVKTFESVTEIYQSNKAGDLNGTAKGMVKGVLVIYSVAGTLLYPTIGTLISNGAQLANDSAQVVFFLYQLELKEAALKALSSAHTIIYLGSILYATPELIAISLLSQAAFEAYKASDHLFKGEYLEAIANIGLACIRSHQARPHLERAQRNMFGEEITQAQFDQLMNEIEMSRQNQQQADNPVRLEALFIRDNLSNNVRNINFARNANNTAYDFMNFDNCSFENKTITNATYSNCSFVNTNLINSVFQSVQFRDCNMKDSIWNYSKLTNVEWYNCDMSGASFNDAIMNRVLFDKCKLFETSFLCTKAAQSAMVNSDLTDCMIWRAKDGFKIAGGIAHKITRPVVGILWDYKSPKTYAKYTVDRLKSGFKALVLKIEMNPDNAIVNQAELRSEIDSSIRTRDPRSDKTVAQHILERGGKHINEIKAKAEETAEALDAFWIPGGWDINPKYYGERLTPHDQPVETDDYRTITEFAMIQQAIKRKLFTLGICRGNQIINVYHGGTLNHHVDDHHSEMHHLKLKNDGSKAYEIMKKVLGGTEVDALSMHHQANLKIGKGLTSILKHEGSSEGIVSNDGNFVGLQFHPEKYLSLRDEGYDDWQANRNVFVYFLDQANKHYALRGSAA